MQKYPIIWPFKLILYFLKKFHDPLEIFHDPLLGLDPSVEKHCSKPFTLYEIIPNFVKKKIPCYLVKVNQGASNFPFKKVLNWRCTC